MNDNHGGKSADGVERLYSVFCLQHFVFTDAGAQLPTIDNYNCIIASIPVTVNGLV